MRFLRRIFLSLAACYLLVCAAIAAFAYVQPSFEPKIFRNTDVIVVLGAGMDPDGTLHQPAILRVEKGVEIYNSSGAQHMHFTGGRAVPNGPSAGGQMAALAIRLGVPEDAITTENASLSTLQNALFSYPTLNGATRIVLVTEGFHLPRAWLSFKWAAWQFDQSVSIQLAHSTAFRGGDGLRPFSMVFREGVAWAFNLTRVATWHITGWVNMAQARRDGWLQ